MTLVSFPHYRFGGNPVERGRAYGEELRDRIHATFELYTETVFAASPLDMSEIEIRAARARELVFAFSPAYVGELDAVAAGAQLPTWQIYALNARTEILSSPPGECTVLYFQQPGVLGQNWDWLAALEDLAVLVTWELPDGHEILMFTEPGMLGKIGLNDRGVGVCLNILFSQHELHGLPVHVLTRALLDCGSLSEVRALIARSGTGKSSHFLVAHGSSGCCSVEFAAGERFELGPTDGVLVHTNHCIATGAEKKAALIPGSAERLDHSHEQLAGVSTRDLATMRKILLDDSRGNDSINMSYHPETLLGNRDVGTCATILMDLQGRRMEIKKGPGRNGAFIELALRA
ncbi:MAG: C45 family autoproteolytic acyltransferase/hydrolase [Gammaproteobacteria bacterium]